MAIERVSRRVEKGGHYVPAETIRRRFRSGLENFFELDVPLANTWRLYDNRSPEGPQRIAAGAIEQPTRIWNNDLWGSIVDEYGRRA